MDEQAGKQPTFSEADLERARTTLRGRPDEAAIYNAWIEAARIVDFTSMEAIGKGARGGEAPDLGDQLDPGSAAPWVAPACQAASHQDPHPGGVGDVPGAAGAGPAGADGGGEDLLRRGDARPGVVAGAGGAEGQGQSLPDFEEGSGTTYDDLRRLDAAAAQQLHRAATAEIVELVKARKLRFVRDGKNVSAKLKSWQARERGG